jgi:hypothetical protein
VTALDGILALFALVMLARNGPLALRVFQGEHKPGNVYAAVTVLLALAILAVAVKGLAEGLISR